MRRFALPVVLLLIAGGLIAWIARNTYWGEVSIPQPLQGAAGTEPFYSAQRLAESLGAHARWQRVLGSMPPRNGVVIASAWHWGLLKNRRERLERWVASGGRLVFDRSLIGGERELQAWAGISRSLRNLREIADSDAHLKYEKCPPLSDGQRPGSRYAVCGLDGVSSLHVNRRANWILRDAHADIQALRIAVGLGSVTWINARPFGNLDLLQGDNGRLFVAASQLHRGDQLWFLTEEQGSSLLSLIWSTGAPVVAIAAVLIVLWLWRAGARFGPLVAAIDPARRSLAEQIRGTGQFTVRFGGGKALHAAAVRALTETANRRIPGYSLLAGPERVATIARLAAVQADELARALSDWPGTGELAQSLTQIESVRRTLATTKS